MRHSRLIAAAALFALVFAAPAFADQRQIGAGPAAIPSKQSDTAILVDPVTGLPVSTAAPLAVQGNVASGATDSGNPVKVGGVYNATAPTLTTGQRGDLQLSPQGGVSIGLVASSCCVVSAGAANSFGATGNNSMATVSGGQYLSTLPTFTTGQYGILQMTPKGALQVSIVRNSDGAAEVLGSLGDAQSIAVPYLYTYNVNGVYNGTTADLSRSIPALATSGIGVQAVGDVGIFKTTAPTLTDGQYGAMQMSSHGGQGAALYNGTAWVDWATMNSGSFAGGANAGKVVNGVSTSGGVYTPQVDVLGQIANAGTGSGAQAVENAGYLFNEITTATTVNAIKTGGTVLHRVVVNTCVASATIKIYNALTATGTPITITCPATLVDPFYLDYDLFFATGLTVVTSGATDVTIGYR